MQTSVLLDRNDRKIIARSVQDVEPILERNKAPRSEPQRSDWGPRRTPPRLAHRSHRPHSARRPTK